MQRMHQSYKYMKAQQNKLVGVHPTRLLTKSQGILRKPIIGIYKPSSIMKNSHQYMKVTTQETLYYEDHGATLKHKCGKRIVALPLLSFSLIFFGLLLFFMASFFSLFLFGPFLWPLFFFFRPESHPDLWGNHSLHHPFLTWDNALKMMIITLLFTYNSTITTKYLKQNMTLCECLRRCTGI